MGPINWLGVAFEIVGLAISGVGLWQTWREFATPNERFLGPIVDGTRAAFSAGVAAVESLVRRILRRPAKPIVVQVGVADMALTTDRLSVRIGYGSLSSEVQTALAELHRRTQELMDKHTRVDERLAGETEAREEAMRAVKEELARSLASHESREQRVAVGGVRTQSAGLFLVVLGLVLQVWRF